MTGAVEKFPTKAMSITGLAAEIRAEHEAVEAAAISAVEHAIRCGELLIEAKAQVRHGNWLPWLSENFDFTRQTATAYMRLYANRDQLQMEGPPSISAALKQIAAPREDRKEVPVGGDVDDDDLREIAARIDSGELDIAEGRDLLLEALSPFERYWLKHSGIVCGEERVEAIRETCEVADVLPMIEDLTALPEESIRFVWVGYVPMDGSEITGPLSFHPGWADFCRDRLGDDVRFATADLMPRCEV
jgi:hypothetical protein